MIVVFDIRGEKKKIIHHLMLLRKRFQTTASVYLVGASLKDDCISGQNASSKYGFRSLFCCGTHEEGVQGDNRKAK